MDELIKEEKELMRMLVYYKSWEKVGLCPPDGVAELISMTKNELRSIKLKKLSLL